MNIKYIFNALGHICRYLILRPMEKATSIRETHKNSYFLNSIFPTRYFLHSPKMKWNEIKFLCCNWNYKICPRISTKSRSSAYLQNYSQTELNRLNVCQPKLFFDNRIDRALAYLPRCKLKLQVHTPFCNVVTQQCIRACSRDNFSGTLSSRLYSTRDIYYAAVLPPLVCQMTLVFVANCNADDYCGIVVSETIPKPARTLKIRPRSALQLTVNLPWSLGTRGLIVCFTRPTAHCRESDLYFL